MSDARYYFTESLWPDLTSSNSIEASERLAARLVEEFGIAFARVVRDDRGQVLTPSWLDVIAMTGDPRGGPVAVVASVSHAALGLPHAFDLAARHVLVGDLALRFPSTVPLNNHAKWLFVRESGDDAFAPVHVGGMVVALDLSPDSTSVAVLEYWGGEAGHTVGLLDLPGRQLRFRAAVPFSRTVEYSPDGAWVLASGTIVDAASGEAFEIPMASARNVAWWPARSASSLLMVANEAGSPPMLSSFDLETAELETLGDVEVAHPGYQWVDGLTVAPDGGSALCGTGSPAPPGFAFGAGHRASVLDITSRRIESVMSGFFEVDGVVIEREHDSFVWIDQPPVEPVSVHDSLRRARVELPLPGADRGERVVRELAQFVEYGLHALEGGTERDLGREILWAWDAMLDLAPSSDAVRALRGRVRELRESTADGGRPSRHHAPPPDERSREERIDWLLEAALAMWERGDLDAAERLDREAYELGDRRAAYNLGLIMAARGKMEEAATFYREAAEAGDAEAAWNLACLLMEQHDWLHASPWLVQAAEAGEARAANALGAIEYARGFVADAERWFLKAAGAGNNDAIANLERLRAERGFQ